MPRLQIISGGQTGVDRGALDAAIDFGFDHGGSCPRGRRAEDGVIPARYNLDELASPRYSVRTEQNVKAADGTLIIYDRQLSGGTLLTQRLAKKHGCPCFLYDIAAPADFDTLVSWLCQHGVDVLNVAGPRESSCPGISAVTRQLCLELFAHWERLAE